MSKKQTRDEIKKEIKTKYSGLFDILAKEERKTGSIYNIEQVVLALRTQNYGSTDMKQYSKSNDELSATTRYLEEISQ